MSGSVEQLKSDFAIGRWRPADGGCRRVSGSRFSTAVSVEAQFLADPEPEASARWVIPASEDTR